MPRATGQKLKLLYLLDYLTENTDEARPASMSDIISHLEARGISAERKSVYGDIDALRLYGADIIYTAGRGGGYFLGSRKFELPEIKLLIDAVQSSRFISAGKARVLTDKLASLAGKQQARLVKRQIISERNRTDNESVLYSIDTVFDAIHENRKISFKYFEYAVESGGIKKRYRREGKSYVVSPVCLVRCDDKYYLVAYENGELRHYRADKLSGVKMLDEQKDKSISPPDMEKYNQSIFSMYGGESMYVTLKCAKKHAGVIADKFGTAVPVTGREDTFSVTVQVQISPLFYSWVCSFGGEIEIISPASVRAEMIDMINKTLDKFKGETKQ